MDSVEDYSSSGVTFAIYLNDGYDNYVEYEGNTFPAKADGYKYNADISNCTDIDGNSSNNYTLYYNNDMVQVSSSESIYCYIYFDMYSYDGDYCLVNGITEYLGECALVMDDYSYTVEAAKESIEDKGEADTSKIAPTITYGKSISTSQTVNVSTTNYFLLGTDYDFDAETGNFALTSTLSPAELTDDYVGYYTCGTTQAGCTTMYKIQAFTITDKGTSITQTITEADIYTYTVNKSIDSGNGLYMTYDDDGPTYYYRGSVSNNYVYFAGYYWRIIRINGDGSVRMIYAGTDANDTSDDSIGKSQFNGNGSDPTYVGYRYGIKSSTAITQSSESNYEINADSNYYFSTEYEEVGDGTFKLSGTLISGTFSELFGLEGTYKDNITEYYTCFSTSPTGTCNVLKKLNLYNSSTSANVYYISYASESYEDTLTNENDSTIKTVVDKWYEENILDKYDESGTNLLSDYISTSAIFCGDRSVYSGSGYLLSETTYYNAYRRITTYNPSLYCKNVEDRYSVDNGNLDYPIALITIDEVSFAGGRWNNVNVLYYLYTGETYWAMTPLDYNSGLVVARGFFTDYTGKISQNYVIYSAGVRPVINLSSNVKISSGTGTASNPFVVT